MKTFEQEYKKLIDWSKKANAEADKKVNNLPERGGYDETQIRLIVSREWNRRLDELKNKYGIETETQEKEPVVKARTPSTGGSPAGIKI